MTMAIRGIMTTTATTKMMTNPRTMMTTMMGMIIMEARTIRTMARATIRTKGEAKAKRATTRTMSLRRCLLRTWQSPTLSSDQDTTVTISTFISWKHSTSSLCWLQYR